MKYWFVDITFLSVAATSGLVAGWLLKRWFGPGVAADGSGGGPIEESEEAGRAGNELGREQAQEVVFQLHSLAARVAAQVGAHSERVQQITQILASSETNSAADVVAAVAELIEANDRMQDQLNTAEKRLQEQAQAIESHAHEARTDALTEIHNRRAFDEEMRRCLDEYRQCGRPTSVMMIDVDYFKKFNDTHGHKAGDKVLKFVAKTLKQSVAATEVVCRYGGEEFAVIFPGTTLSGTCAAAERARGALSQIEIEYEGQPLQITASAGLAEFLPADDVETVVKRADDALYTSKNAGRNCGHFHDGHVCIPFVTRDPGTPNDRQRADSAEFEKPSSPATDLSAGGPTKDQPTGLSNRTAYYDDVNRRVAEWKRGGRPLSVMFMQIDQYNGVTGDNADKARSLMLRAATQFLRATVRDMDHMARYDDDTLAVLLPTARLENTFKIAERLRRSVARCKLPFQDGHLCFTVSIGMAEATQGDSTSRLLQRAKIALDTCQDFGGDLIFVHTGDKCLRAEEYLAGAEEPAKPVVETVTLDYTDS